MTLARLQQLFDVFTALVVVSLAIALAALTWRITGYDDGRREVALATAPSVGAAVDVTPILLLSPFGSALGVPGAPVAGASSLGLTLRGIVFAVPRNASAALIAGSDGVAASYGIGQTVAGGAIVEDISIDSVTLRVGGGTEVLAFPDPTAASGSAIPAGASSSPGAAAVRALIPPEVSGVPPPVVPAAPPSPTVDAATPLATPTDPAALLTTLGAVAGPDGYRVGAGAAPQLLAAGLQPGDVIASVNGVAVGDLNSDRRVFDQAVASGRARVEVIREGRRLTLTFPLR